MHHTVGQCCAAEVGPGMPRWLYSVIPACRRPLVDLLALAVIVVVALAGMS